MILFRPVLALAVCAAPAAARRPPAAKGAQPAPAPAASIGSPAPAAASPGSLYVPGGRYADLGRDFRASQIGDIVTILVEDKASALSKGATSSSRQSAAKASVTSLAGPLRAAGPLANLAAAESDRKLDGQGETSRESEITTSLAARVTQVLPNGDLALEGAKEVAINSEKQRIIVRGVARWNDLTPANRIRSERLADLQILIEGKGVVQDAIRRPNFLYRLLLGLLPF
jgi:flagellar L-ring protein precursor FlgH